MNRTGNPRHRFPVRNGPCVDMHGRVLFLGADQGGAAPAAHLMRLHLGNVESNNSGRHVIIGDVCSFRRCSFRFFFSFMGKGSVILIHPCSFVERSSESSSSLREHVVA
jgi:hypothetical protein